MEENSRQSRHYALIAKAQSGDGCESQEATETLLRENMGLVRGVAQRFLSRGVEYEDLLQIGVIGMLRAIRGFDLSRGLAFSTFAVSGSHVSTPKTSTKQHSSSALSTATVTRPPAHACFSTRKDLHSSISAAK